MSLVDKSIEKKTWKEFKNSFGFKVANKVLHLFGWYLMFTDTGYEITEVTPHKVKGRRK